MSLVHSQKKIILIFKIVFIIKLRFENTCKNICFSYIVS